MNEAEVDLAIEHIPAGRYIIAVSGGIDSMVLLHVLQQYTQIELIVAHFDHGIRSDSWRDREFVEKYATSHNMKFVYETKSLGPQAGELLARSARYSFLRRVRKEHNARGIILAHHQDDLLETAIINLLRGTGWQGLRALRSRDDLIRPFLGNPKTKIVAYAAAQNILWREDPTNQDRKYLRNYVRHEVLTYTDEKTRNELLSIIVRHSILSQTIDKELINLFGQYSTVSAHSTALPRYQMIMLPGCVAYELLQYGIKNRTGSTIEKPLAQRALLFVKTAHEHKRFTLDAVWQLRIERRIVIVEPKRS